MTPITSSVQDAISLKLNLLSQGITVKEGFLDFYAEHDELIEKRRPYGNGDRVVISDRRVPQELILHDSVICAANNTDGSKWALSTSRDMPVIEHEDQSFPISFPKRPLCYGHRLSNGELLERVVTVYGDKTLGIFSPGHCYFFNDDSQCKFCSLGPARETAADHRMKILPELAAEAISVAISREPTRYRHVLLNGGSVPDYDKGFERHLSILERVVALGLPPTIQTHLISMPPKDFSLFERFAELGGTLAMSLEVFDPEHFIRICPGKHRDYGRDRFIEAYRAAVQTIGHGRVYAGFVAGLEPLESIERGIEFFGDLGIVPAVAVFHPDAGSVFEDFPRPSVEFLRAVGKKMAEVYAKNGFRAFIEGSGRNSLDTEAVLGGFA